MGEGGQDYEREAVTDPETEVDFEDTDLTFDKDLESFRVAVADLKRSPEKRIFWAWLSAMQQREEVAEKEGCCQRGQAAIKVWPTKVLRSG